MLWFGYFDTRYLHGLSYSKKTKLAFQLIVYGTKNVEQFWKSTNTNTNTCLAQRIRAKNIKNGMHVKTNIVGGGGGGGGGDDGGDKDANMCM
jgi:hypothetical protein